MASCCVEGCKNLTYFSGSENKSISFHLFPKNKELKKKWLRVLGCPDWNPPDKAHVCSAHFSRQQMVQVNKNLWTIKKDAYPDKAFPVQVTSNMNLSSNVEVCRMCLATDVKMFSLKNNVLKTYIETIAVLHQNSDAEGLPQFVCYLCAGYLLKTNIFIEKCMIAQATLLEIYAENFRITKPLVEEQNRQKLNLVHSLQRHNSTPTKVFEYKYDDNLKVSVLTNHKSYITEKSYINGKKQVRTKKRSLGDTSSEINNDKNLNMLCKKLKKNINSVNLLQDTDEESLNGYDNSSEKPENLIGSKRRNKNLNKADDSVVKDGSKASKDNSENESEDYDSDRTTLGSISCNDYDMTSEDENFLSSNEQDSLSNDVEGNESHKDDKENKEKKRSNMFRSRSNVLKNVDTKKESQKQQPDRLKKENIKTKGKQNTENEEDPVQKKEIYEYFKVVELTLDEQIKEWDRKYKKSKYKMPGTMQCYMCSKLFLRREAFVNHLAGHDPGRGDSECPVCKLCYANESLLNRHIKYKHLHRYHCKLCPSIFNNVTSALMHRHHHKARENKSKKCGVIFESTDKTSNLRQHELRLKTLETKCDQCDRHFLDKTSLRKHIERRHSQFKSKSEREHSKSKLKSAGLERESGRHTRSVAREIITNETFYKCPACDEMFRHSTSLEQHVQNVHLNLSEMKYSLINNESNEDINDTETIGDDVTKEYLELDDDDIDDSKFQFTEINHVTINEPIVIGTKNGKKKSTINVIGKLNEKEYLDLREVENSNLRNMNQEEFEEIESVQNAWLTDEEERQDYQGLGSEDEIMNGEEKIENNADVIINNRNKKYSYVNEEFVDDQEIYEELEVLEIDELEENIEL